jgi:hypothetical protein
LFEFPDRTVRERDGNHILVVPGQAGIQSGLKNKKARTSRAFSKTKRVRARPTGFSSAA